MDKKIAAGVLPICSKTNRILLCKRGKEQNFPLHWASWGGGFEEEKDETPKDCAKREFREETRYDGKYKISSSPINIYKNNFITFYMYVGVFEEEFIPDIISENEASGWGWFSLDELPTPIIDGMIGFFRDNKEKLKKIAKRFK